MKMLKTTLLSFFLLMSIMHVTAQTADEIVNKWTAAMGGLDKLGSIKTIYAENDLNIMNNMAPGKSYTLNGKGFRSETDFNGQQIIDCYTVNDGWTVNPLAGQPTPVKMPEAQIKPGQLRLDAAGPLYNYAAKGTKIELLGKEDVNGAQAYKIGLTTSAGTKETLFLDVNTYYILKESTTISGGGQDVEITTTFSDYRKTADGFIMPYANNFTLPGLSVVVTAKKIEVNKPIDPAIFQMPKN